MTGGKKKFLILSHYNDPIIVRQTVEVSKPFNILSRYSEVVDFIPPSGCNSLFVHVMSHILCLVIKFVSALLFKIQLGVDDVS